LVSKLFTDNRAKRGPKVKIEVENIFVRRSLVRQSDLLSVFNLGHVSDEINQRCLTRLKFKWSQPRSRMGVMKTPNPLPISRAFMDALRTCYARNVLPTSDVKAGPGKR
jgi:DNA-binding transcriptional LysR family regulator